MTEHEALTEVIGNRIYDCMDFQESKALIKPCVFCKYKNMDEAFCWAHRVADTVLDALPALGYVRSARRRK